uniref:Ependymin-like 1 n=1 Tax=Oreochromis aureus TaxID=47969 RepID=A0AAZ1X3L1_OREAU
MKVLVLLVCLSVGCLSTANQKLLAFSKYIYDGLGERIRFRQFRLYDNKTYHLDVLLLYREVAVMYKINNKNRTCTKQRLSPDFHPLAVPRNATLMGQVVLGASSGPGQGILVNSWYREQKMKTGSAKYFTTVTEFGCIPVSTLYHTSNGDWVGMVFFFNDIDPQKLNPPFFCMNAEQGDEDEPVTFLSLFKD